MRIVCLVSIGGLAVLWDFYSRRIPNQLTGTGFLAAFSMAMECQWATRDIRFFRGSHYTGNCVGNFALF